MFAKQASVVLWLEIWINIYVVSASFLGATGGGGCRTEAWEFVEKIATGALQLQALQQAFWKKIVERQKPENWWKYRLIYVNPLPSGSKLRLHNVPSMKKDCMWIPAQVPVDPYTSLPRVWCDFVSSPLLIHFAILDASILCIDDLVFLWWIMFSPKDCALLLSQWTCF